MSCESTVLPSSMFSRVLSIVWPWGKRSMGPAHPWTAYKPTTYLAGAAPEGIIIATKARQLICSSSTTAEPQGATAVAVETKKPELQLVSDDSTVVEPVRVVESDAPFVQELPGIAAHSGHDFQFAARLRSVATQNGPVRQKAVLANNAPKAKAPPVRRTRIEPPAVLKKKPRKTGQVIPFASLRRTAQKSKLRIAA